MSLPQIEALLSDADVVGYGGAAGGGKTDLMIGAALIMHEVTAIFRREATQLTGIIERMTEILGTKAGYNGTSKIWRLGKQRVEFGSTPHAGDEKKHQGKPKDLLAFDETANFLESQVRFLMGWNRSATSGQWCRTLMTFNPPTSAEGQWIIAFFGPWLQRNHPNPARPGELRYFAVIDGTDIEVADKRPFVLVDETRVYDFDPAEHKPTDIITPQSRTFIPAKITDNPYLMGTGYVTTLQSMPEPLRSQMLNGDFAAGLEDNEWQVIPSAWVEAAQDRWTARGQGGTTKGPMDSMGVDVARGGRDETIISRRHGDWFDELVTYPGTASPDGPTVAGYVIVARRDQAPVHIDVVGWGASPYDFLQSNSVHTIAVNGAAVSRDTYADLFTAIGETYGSGDGSTTFNLPSESDVAIQNTTFIKEIDLSGLTYSGDMTAKEGVSATFDNISKGSHKTGASITGSSSAWCGVSLTEAHKVVKAIVSGSVDYGLLYGSTSFTVTLKGDDSTPVSGGGTTLASFTTSLTERVDEVVLHVTDPAYYQHYWVEFVVSGTPQIFLSGVQLFEESFAETNLTYGIKAFNGVVNTTDVDVTDLANDIVKLETDKQNVIGVFSAQYRLSDGTSTGNGTAGAWNLREFNTEVFNSITNASLVDSVFTLPAGTYRVYGGAATHDSNTTKCELRDATGTTTIAQGRSYYSGSGDTTALWTTINTIFTLDEETSVTLYQYFQSAGSKGYAVAGGATENVHAELTFELIASEDTFVSGGVEIDATELDNRTTALETIVNDLVSVESNEVAVDVTDVVTDVVALQTGKQDKLSFLHVREQYTSGTSGGASVTGWQTRDINTEITNTISGASLDAVAHTVTLPAGTYRVTGGAAAYGGGSSINGIAELRSEDGLTILAQGRPHRTEVASHLWTPLDNVFVLDEETVVAFYQWLSLGRSSNGLGVSHTSGRDEVFCDLLIEKVA